MSLALYAIIAVQFFFATVVCSRAVFVIVRHRADRTSLDRLADAVGVLAWLVAALAVASVASDMAILLLAR